MILVYAREEAPRQYAKSLFLMGPTPRSQSVRSWRPDVLRELELQGYDGVVFIPEDRPDAHGNTTFRGDYTDQVEWEDTHLHLADVILAYVPRELPNMPGFTTNVEWGVWQASGKIVLGSPPGAVKNRYLIHQAHKLGVPVADSPATTVQAALRLLGPGSYRSNGERYIPLHIWQQPLFQEWYRRQRQAGQSLGDARVCWTYWSEDKPRRPLHWTLEVSLAKDDHCYTELVIGSPHDTTNYLVEKGTR